jgi:hypothetical protein
MPLCMLYCRDRTRQYASSTELLCQSVQSCAWPLSMARHAMDAPVAEGLNACPATPPQGRRMLRIDRQD